MAGADASGTRATLYWAYPGNPDNPYFGDPAKIASYRIFLQRAGGPAGAWRMIANSDSNTTAATIDLPTGQAVAGTTIDLPIGEAVAGQWTVHLRARGVNGKDGEATFASFTTRGNEPDDTPVPPDGTPVPPDDTPVPPDGTPVPPDGTPGSVPALPLAGLVTLAVVLFLSGLRKR